MTRRLWLGLALILLLGVGGGLYAWQPWNRKEVVTGSTGLGATYVVDRGNLSRSLTAYGEILPKDEATFTFAEARLGSLHVRLGDAVDEGDVLAVLDSTQEELALARAERALAQARADGVPTTIREREIEAVLARASYEATTIRSPFSGVVAEAARLTGTAAGQYRIVVLDRSVLSVRISVAETDANQVRVGQRATVTLDAVQGSSWPAEIVEMGLRATQASGFGGGRGVQAAVRLLQTDERILPGFSAQVQVVVAEARNVLRVPIEALVQHVGPREDQGLAEAASEELGEARPRIPAADLLQDQMSDWRARAGDGVTARTPGAAEVTTDVPTSRDWAVYVLVDGEPALRPVEIGLTTAQYAEVRSGLSEGDVILRYPSATRTTTGATQRTTAVPGGIFR